MRAPVKKNPKKPLSLQELHARLTYWRSQIGIRESAVKNVRELERQVASRTVNK